MNCRYRLRGAQGGLMVVLAVWATESAATNGEAATVHTVCR
jgi:hypothetical protein